MDFGTLLMYGTFYFSLFTGIFFLLSLLENRGGLSNPRPGRIPSVCIAVPAFNEEKTISKTIRSLLALDYPKGLLTIIVVDDGSTDSTGRISRAFEKQGVKVFAKKNGGKASALNFALKRANAELFGALDADSFVRPDALRKMVGFFENPSVMAVTPSLKVYSPRGVLQKVQYMEYLLGVYLRKVFAFLDSIHVTPGPFTIYRRSFFERHGGYEEDNPTEDIEIALRLQENNYWIENSVYASVYTVAPGSFMGLLRQRIRWYTGFLLNVMRHRSLFSARHGHLGMFVLPGSLVSILLVVITLFYALYVFVFRIIFRGYLNLRAVNFDFLQFFKPVFDPFRINIGASTYVLVLSLALGIVMVCIAKRMGRERVKVGVFYLFYLAIYWVLFGFWWVVSFFHLLSGKKVAWGQRQL